MATSTSQSSIGGKGAENRENSEQNGLHLVEQGLRKQFFNALQNNDDLPSPEKAKEVLAKMQAEKDRFTKEELQEYQELVDAAEEHDRIMRELKDIGKYPLSRINMLLSRAQIYRTKLMEPMSEVQAIRDLLSNEEVHRRNQFLENSNKELREDYDNLVKVCEQTELAAKNMDFLHKTGLAMYRDKTMTYRTLMHRLDYFEQSFRNFHERNKMLPTIYLDQIPSMKVSFFEEGKGVEYEGLSKLIQFRNAMKVFRKLGKELHSVKKMRERLAKDMGMKSVSDLRFENGAMIKLNGKVGKIVGVEGDQATGGVIKVEEAGGVASLSPAEFYFHLLTESKFFERMDGPVKVEGAEYTPAFKDVKDLEKAFRSDKDLKFGENVHLEKVGKWMTTTKRSPISLEGKPENYGKTKDKKEQVVVRSVFEDKKGGAIIAIHEIDEDKKTITYLSGYSKDSETQKESFQTQETVSYQKFYDLIRRREDGKFAFEYKSAATDPEKPYWSITNWSEQVKTKPSTMPPVFSIGAAMKAFKRLGERFDRMGDERRDMNAANLTKLMAKYADKLPWCSGVYNVALTEENEFLLSKVKKWSEQYKAAFKTNEFEDAFKNFHKLPKIRQAGMLLAAGGKGMSKAEVYHLLQGESYERAQSLSTVKKTGHNEYRQALFGYFCVDGAADSIPRRYESMLTPALDDGYDKQISIGYKESVNMVSPDDILDMHAAYVTGRGKFDPETGTIARTNTKRLRMQGLTEALLKYGTGAENMGKQTFWTFGLVSSSKYADEKGIKMRSNFTEMMMRRLGNFGKGTVPMLGLFRFPDGMAHARALTDFYINATGENPYKRHSEGERIMGLLFAGRFEQVENQLQMKIGIEKTKQFKWLYLKARFMALHYEEGADFNYKYSQGGYLDETMLGDAYGASILSKQWLETLLATDNNGDGKHAVGVQMSSHGTGEGKTGWWWTLKDKLNEVTEDERKMFAINLIDVLMDTNETHFYWRKRHDVILPILKKYLIKHGDEKITFVDSEQKTWLAKDFQEVEDHLKKMKKLRGVSYTLTHLEVPHDWLHATQHSMSQVARKTLEPGGYKVDGNYNVSIPKRTEELIEMSKTHYKEIEPQKHGAGHHGVSNVRDITKANREKMKAMMGKIDKKEDAENYVGVDREALAKAA